jgi:hypothetical protein
MDSTTALTIVAAPVLVPVAWWFLTRPGKALHNYLWRKLPDGRIRRALLRKVSDKVLPAFVKDG